MKSKPQRWYEIIDGTAYIYDTPYPQTATSVSIVPVSDLAYYRAQFTLHKIWSNSHE